MPGIKPGWKRAVIVGLIAISLGWGGSGGVAGVQARSADFQSQDSSLVWEYQLDFSAETSGSASQQAYRVSPNLNSQGVATFLQAIGGNQYRLDMSGRQGLDQLRQALFSPLLAGFINGPAEIELAVPASGLQDLRLQLEANLSTGYCWEIDTAGTHGFAPLGQPGYMTRSAGYGVPGVQALTLHPSDSAGGIVKLAYRRSFGPQETASRHLRITSTLPLSSLDLSNPHPQKISSLSSGADTLPASDPYSSLKSNASLPASLDWRAKGIVPAVRNQGSCGSCWAFGTVGIMESAIARIGTPMVDLSEQFLVSCNTYGWNCDDGGLTAHMWHYDMLGKNQSSIGAVLEASKPYTATNGSCNIAYAHPYTLSGWQFIVSNEWTLPEVDQIKSAIASYGPVTAGVCVGPQFQWYHGGIFKTNEYCGGGTNHQIILVGWQDDAGVPGGGYWILRNSWGPWWGEDGYMRIAYHTSRVGEGTSWVTIGNKYYFPVVGR